MSRPSPKGRTHRKEHTHTLSGNKVRREVVFVALAIILAGIPFCLGKYFEFSTPDPYDSPANVYSAEHIVDGAKLGVQEKPAAATGTLLVNMLGVWLFGYSEFGPKFLQGVAQVAALVLMFYATRKVFGLLSAAVAVVVASVYLSAPLIAKFGNVKDQFMTAFMIIAVSLFILRQLGSSGWLAFLAGGFLAWGPLFKETGCSAIGAVGLFLIWQPIAGHRTWKQTALDISLLIGGAAVSIVPIYIWLALINAPSRHWPYFFVCKAIGSLLPASVLGAHAKPQFGYVSGGRKLIPFSEQWPRVLRYYGLLILPIALAAGGIGTRLFRVLARVFSKKNLDCEKDYERFVVLLAVWWLLDMAFVWISPRSYEQYYLALNGSAAMLGGYLVALYSDGLRKSIHKTKWVVVGLAALICMIVMSWHIFFGIETSPHTGRKYGARQRGYVQRLKEISSRRENNLKMPWEAVGEYINTHSEPTDRIYVWGWIPGIYLKAQRLSASPKAFSMPRPQPSELAERVAELLDSFEKNPPKFIVDTRKLHVPTNRPPYELWPIVPKGFMGFKQSQFLPPNNKELIDRYDLEWARFLAERFGEDEAERYRVLKPLREFVMTNYRIVSMFGQHVLFERKGSVSDSRQQP